MVISRLTSSQASACRGEIALDPLQILAEAVDLAYVAFDRKTLVLRQRLHREPGPAFPIEQVGRRAWRDQVCVQNRLDDVLQPRALADNLITPRHLPSQRLGAWIGDPDFRQEAAGVELREHRRVDLVRLDLGVRDDPHLLGIGNDHPLYVRADHFGDRCRITGRLDDHLVVLAELLGERLQQRPPHIDAAEACQFPRFEDCHLGKCPVDVHTHDAHARSPFLARRKREPAGNTTPTDPRSQRIRESRQGRPCNEPELAAHGLSAACPHLRAPGAPRPGWAHHMPGPQ